MNEENHGRFIKLTFLVVLIVFSLLIVIISLLSIPLRTKATANMLTIKIKIQGNHKSMDQIKAHIDFYNGPEKAFEEPEVVFTYDKDSFKGDITLKSDFSFTDQYALFIKPVGYIGRVFCSSEINGDKCKMPAFFFLASGSTVDLTSQIFLAGDIPPAHGRVDARDMSLIMKDLGKMSTADAPLVTDLNGDGITDVVDYSLAFYSISNNAQDDNVSLTAPLRATPTPEPSDIPTPTPTTIPTGTPAPTPTPTPTTYPTPTIAPTVTPSATPAPTNTPTPTSIPTTTPTTAPTIAPTSGT